MEAPAAGRIEPVSLDGRGDRRSGAHEQRQPHPRRGDPRRRPRIVRAAFEPHEIARTVRLQQRGQHGLQHQRRAAGGPDRERIAARRDRALGLEHQSLRAPVVAPSTSCAADLGGWRGRPCRCCRSRPGLGSRPPRMRSIVKGLAGDQRKRQRRAEDWPPPSPVDPSMTMGFISVACRMAGLEKR